MVSLNNSNTTIATNAVGRDVIRDLYVALSVVTITGNGFVCALFMTKKSLLQQPSNRFILLLAVVDSLTAVMVMVSPTSRLLGSPYPYPRDRIARRFVCVVIYSEYFIWGFGYISIYTIAMLSIERLCLVVRPIFHKRFFTPNRVNSMIIVLILIGLLLSILNPLQIKISANRIKPCRFVSLPVSKSVKYFIVVLFFILQILLPALIALISYVIIIYRMQKIGFTPSEAPVDMRSQRTRRSRRRITLMIFLASVALFICWLPNGIYFTLIQLRIIISLRDTFHFITKTLVIANSAINPIIYVTVNAYYRKLLVDMLRKLIPFRHKRHKFNVTVPNY